MAPTYNDAAYHSLVSMKNHENIFSPLSSPALNPSSSSTGDQSSLQQKLAFIERQQQQLRNMHNQLRPTASPILNSNGYTSPLISYQEPKKSLKKLMSSPRPFAIPKSAMKCESPLALKPMTPHTTFVNKSPNIASSTSASSSISSSASSSSTSKSNHHGFIAPATPSLLMKLGNGNHSVATINTSPSTSSSSSSVVDNMPILPAAMLQQEEINEPKRRRISNPSPPSLHHQNDILASPASLRPQQSPRALKPLISPSLKPNGKRLSSIEEETARALLTSKSNYENLKEGKAKSLGIDFSTTIQSGIENRRSAHKAAEQKRRDTLKQSFDSLRTEIIDAMMEEELAEQAQDAVDRPKEEEIRNIKEKDVKQMSKVVLLQHSYEYILRLKSDNKRKDEKQAKMRQELIALRQQLGLPETTKEEEEAEEKERLEEKEKRQARLKRLQSVAAAGDEASSST